MKWILLPALAFFLTHFCQKQTDGFTIAKIAKFSIESIEDPMNTDILQQRFLYLGKGGQSYVFASEDGKFVLKFLRGSRLNLLKCFEAFPGMRKKVFKSENKLKETLKSYSLAKQSFQNETGLIAIHQGASLPLKIRIVDKLNIEHQLDVNSTPFILQKRAHLVKETIDKMMGDGDVMGAKMALENLLKLVAKLHAKNLEDGDPNLAKNFGFIGKEPIEIDPGRYRMCPSPALARIAGSKEDLEHWLNKNHPTLSEHFNAQYQTHILRQHEIH